MGLAAPGFHLAQPDGAGPSYSGGWRFSPELGADVSQSGDSASLQFWGSEIGLRVRRGDYRGRLHVTVDGRPANALPRDDAGAALVLTAPTTDREGLETIIVARNLPPGPHRLTLTADWGAGEWALHGFEVGYRPADTTYRWGAAGLTALGLLCLISAGAVGWRADWGAAGQWVRGQANRLRRAGQQATAALNRLANRFIWTQKGAEWYGRLSDGRQLALLLTIALIFYIAPWPWLFLPLLALLTLLIFLRPVWGLFLIVLTIPFYVPLEILKPVVSHYRLAAVEMFTLVTAVAYAARWLTDARPTAGRRWSRLDWAVLLFVAAATISTLLADWPREAWREWRTVIVEPALFYFLLRGIRPSSREMWTLIHGFLLGGLAVAGWGLWQFAFQRHELSIAEEGLLRLRANFGSPNNAALYIGRVLPFALAVALTGAGRRRLAYGAAVIPLAVALALTMSKGSLLIGLPGALLLLLILWRWREGKAVWPVIAAILIAAPILLALVMQIPTLAARFDVQGATTSFRVYLWRASLNMSLEHPLFGVGPDNFLYHYRGRYIFDATWPEPNLSHAHNLIFDLSSRLGLIGLLLGGGLVVGLGRTLWQTIRRKGAGQWPAAHWPLTLGLAGAAAHFLLHGLVDQSLFLVDLFFSFYLLLALSLWLRDEAAEEGRRPFDK
jgi:O-antigen ligase